MTEIRSTLRPPPMPSLRNGWADHFQVRTAITPSTHTHAHRPIKGNMGPGSIWRCLTSSISIPIIKIRRRHYLRILIMESLYLERPLYWDWPLDPDRDLEHPHSLITGYLHHFRKDVPRIPWWRHQMETFSALLALCAGEFPCTKASDAELWCFLSSAPQWAIE